LAGNSKNERISQARQQGVLLDTSLWIRYFRPQGDEEVKAQVKRALLAERVFTCWVVKAELLVGARDEEAFEQLGSFGRNTHHQGGVAWGGPAWIYPAAQWDYYSSSGLVDRPARYFRKT